MSTCTRCGAGFTCGLVDSAEGTCWCMRLPPQAPVPPPGSGCWCPACLAQHSAQSAPAASATPPGDT